MWCCGDSSAYAPVDTNNPQKNSFGGVSAFPGQRRVYQAPADDQNKPVFMSTGGNALTEYDPSKINGNQLVAVTIPEGTAQGQTLHVTAPDGSGRVIAAQVPPGMQPGSTFHVEIPSVASPGSAQMSSVFDSIGGATGNQAPEPINAEVAPVVATPVPSEQQGKENEISYQPYNTNFNGAAQQSQFAQAVSPPPQQHSLGSTNKQNQGLLNVQVPPGTAPGSSIHVQVPGENRVITATVPPNVTQFQVAYQPTKNSVGTTQNIPAAPSPPSTQNGGVAPNIPNQAYVLVKVPPGTAPRSTLHVQIPGENRVIAAVVPPNVSEFQVAYTPERVSGTRPQQQQYQLQQQGNGKPNNSNSMAHLAPMVAAPILLGGAAAAGYAMMHHNNNGANNAADDNYGDGGYGDGDDGGFDDGGGDFGGDYE